MRARCFFCLWAFFVRHLLKTKKRERKQKLATKNKGNNDLHHALPQTSATSLTPRRRFLHELNELMRHPPQPPRTIGTSVTSGKTTNFVEKNAIENGFYFFTYECCWRWLPLIKMISGMEEVLILLLPRLGTSTCFKCRRTRLKSEVIYSGKDSIRF